MTPQHDPLAAALHAHDLTTLESTRIGLHAVAEHLLAGCRYRATGRIGLRVGPGRVFTPEFDDPPAGTTVLAIDVASDGAVPQPALVVVREGIATTHPLTPNTSLLELAQASGLTLGAPDNYPTATHLDPTAPLAIDPAASADLFAALNAGAEVLHDVSERLAAEGREVSETQLWPEHFDLGFSAAEVNYGISCGDGEHAHPYAYVGPWSKPDDAAWPEPWGFSLSLATTCAPDDIRAFLLNPAT